MKSARPSVRARRSQRDPHPPTWDERLVPFLRAWWPEIVGVSLLLAGGLTLAALAGYIPLEVNLIASWGGALRTAFGWGAPVVALACLAAGGALVVRRLGWGRGEAAPRLSWMRLVAAEGAFMAALGPPIRARRFCPPVAGALWARPLPASWLRRWAM